MPASEPKKTNGTSPAVAKAPVPQRDDAGFGLLAALAMSGAAGGSYGSLKESLKGAITSDPFDATVVTVLGGAFLFYVAEKGSNPKVTTYWDALVFISTCMSVGYADVFARTPAGKAIASAVMTLGPAMSGAIFDPPASKESSGERPVPPELFRVQAAIVDKLDAILQELRAARTQQ
jgi:voltage-gated potassium channel